MAMVLPVFFIILFGFIEISRLHFTANSVQVALIKSARTLALPNATDADGIAAAKTYLTNQGFGQQRISVDVSNPSMNEVSVVVAVDMEPIPYTIRRTLVRRRE